MLKYAPLVLFLAVLASVGYHLTTAVEPPTLSAGTVPSNPRKTTPLRYVGTESCKECHKKEYDLWKNSDHDKAMDVATDATVLGDFNNATFTHFGFEKLAELPDSALAELAKRIDATTWARALHEVTPEVYIIASEELIAKLKKNATPEKWAEIQKAIAWNKVIRPCDVQVARQKVDDEVRKLHKEGVLKEIPTGVTSTFFKRDGKFFVNTDGADGKMTDFEVQYVFGHWPLQQYLIQMPNRGYQCLGVTWDSVAKKWYHLYPEEEMGSDSIFHWTSGFQNWNHMCAECHTTNYKKSYDIQKAEYHSTWDEPRVGCETCHGPGSLHNKLAKEDGKNDTFPEGKTKGFALLNLKDPSSKVEIENCAPCHARRSKIASPNCDGKPLPKTSGHQLLDAYFPSTIVRPSDRDGARSLYYADGQIMDEDYVYGSFIQSKMYQNGVRCSDCHDPHSLKAKFLYDDPKTPRGKVVTNETCTSCHLGRHPAGQYDSPAHHHHPKINEPGSYCVDCHMPETTYMVCDPRRDHSMRVPRPDWTTKLGIPNACNNCHNDPKKGETAQWAQDWIEKWYAADRKSKITNFAEVIDAGKRGTPEGKVLLEKLLRRKDLDVSLRCSAMLLLSYYCDTQMPELITRELKNADPLVRTTAVIAVADAVASLLLGPQEVAAYQALQKQLAAGKTLPPQAQAFLRHRPSGEARLRDKPQKDKLLYDYLTPLLSDPVASVSMEAVQRLAGVSQTLFTSQKVKDQFLAAIKQIEERDTILNDQAGYHLNMAQLYQQLCQGATVGRSEGSMANYWRRKAERASILAVRIEDRNPNARYQLGMHLQSLAKTAQSQGRTADAKNLFAGAKLAFRGAIKANPEMALPNLFLARLYYDEKKFAESIPLFEKARGILEREQIDPALLSEIFMLLGDAYGRTGNFSKAQARLERAILLAPDYKYPQDLLKKYQNLEP